MHRLTVITFRITRAVDKPRRAKLACSNDSTSREIQVAQAIANDQNGRYADRDFLTQPHVISFLRPTRLKAYLSKLRKTSYPASFSAILEQPGSLHCLRAKTPPPATVVVMQH